MDAFAAQPHPPHSFGIVEANVYRTNTPVHANFSFLRRLNLKTAVILSPEKPLREFEEFVVEANIDMVFSLSRSSLALFILISPLFFPLVSFAFFI